MIEYPALALAGFVAFLIMLAKQAPLRPGYRAPEIVLAICSAITVVFLVIGAADRALPADFAAAAARILAFYSGVVCGYLAYRLYPRREHRPVERPRMSPGYEAASHRMDEIFEAIRTDAAKGPPSSQDPRGIVSYEKMIDEAGEALLRQATKGAQALRQATIAGFLITVLAVLYILFQFLTA